MYGNIGWISSDSYGGTNPQPQVRFINDPTGSGKGVVADITFAGTVSSDWNGIFARIDDLYAAGSHTITVEWEQYRTSTSPEFYLFEDLRSYLWIEGDMGYWTRQYGLQFPARLYAYDDLVSSPSLVVQENGWDACKLVVDFDANTVTATVNGVSTAAFEMQGDALRWAGIGIIIYATSYKHTSGGNPAGSHHYIANLKVNTVPLAPAKPFTQVSTAG